MYPRDHAIVSAAVIAAYVLLQGIPFPAAAWWFAIGITAGVFVDLDHVLLVAVFGDRSALGRWLFRPWAPFTHPRELLSDLEYGKNTLYYHRIPSHVGILLVLVLASHRFPVLTPAVLTVLAHIVSDIAWDLWNRNYGLSF